MQTASNTQAYLDRLARKEARKRGLVGFVYSERNNVYGRVLEAFHRDRPVLRIQLPYGYNFVVPMDNFVPITPPNVWEKAQIAKAVLADIGPSGTILHVIQAVGKYTANPYYIDSVTRWPQFCNLRFSFSKTVRDIFENPA